MEGISFENLHSKSVKLETIQAALRDDPSLLEKMTEKYNREENVDEGNTLLITCALFGNLAAVEYLLSVGANIEAKNMV